MSTTFIQAPESQCPQTGAGGDAALPEPPAPRLVPEDGTAAEGARNDLFSPRLALELPPQYRLAGLLLALHGLALGCAWVSLQGLPLAIVGFATVLSAWRCAAEAWLALPDAIVRVEFGGTEAVGWEDRRGRRYTGQLGKQAVVWPALVLFSLVPRAAGRRRWVVMAGGAADSGALRALRVRLRWREDGDSGRKRPVE